MPNKLTNRLNRGFTLIELLVVIAIIGILSSIVLSSLKTARSKGANSTIKSNLANGRAQAELFYANNSDSYVGGANVCSSVAAADGTKSIKSFVQAAHDNSSATAANIFFTAVSNQVDTTSSVCHAAATASGSAYAASVPLKVAESGKNYWCIDSTGFSGGRALPLGANTVVCPAS